jgi:hypothetical protein
MLQSGLDNLKRDNLIPLYSEVEQRVQFNRYVCGINLLIRTLDYPKLKWWFIFGSDQRVLTLYGTQVTGEQVKK